MAVTINNRHTIKPAEQTPIIKISLPEIDQTKPVTHAPTIYFYKPAPADDYPFGSAVETLKTSLGKVLVHFYPLAGRLNWMPGGENRLELDCNSMGAEIYEAECDLILEDYGDFAPTPELRKLIPFVDYINVPIDEIPLLMVQITQFRCGGRSVGIAISHSLVDGVSALHFISEWARIAGGLPLSLPPFLDRTKPWEIANPDSSPLPELNKFEHTELKPLPLLIGRQNTMEERAKPSKVSLLKLTKSQIEQIKNKANSDQKKEQNSNNRPYSRYESIAAHVWKTASKSRNLKPEQLTRIRMAVDVRNRTRPPLPEGYFGNAILATVATSTASDLIEKPLSYVCSIIRESIGKVTNEYIRSSINLVKEQGDMNQFRSFHSLGCTEGNFYGNPNMDITSWISLPLYGTDFGWGKEFYMGPGALGYDGKCFIISGIDNDGSLVLALRMQVEHIGSFEKFLYEDILI